MKYLRKYLVTLPVILVAVLVAHLMQPYFDRTNVVMVYMLAVVVVAFRLGGGPATLACLLSVFLFDFINVPPYFSLGEEVYEYVFTLIVMLITAGIISTLAGRLRQKVEESKDRESRTASLYALSAELAGMQSDKDIIQSSITHLAQAFHADVKVLHAEDWMHYTATANEGNSPVAEVDFLSSSGKLHIHEADHRVYGSSPLIIEGDIRFVVLLETTTRWLGSLEQREYLSAMLGQCVQAMERAILMERVHEKEIVIQKELLRNSILNTVSHDLRTPLASIIGASSSLMAEGESFSEKSREQLRSVIFEEANHMMHMVENILDMAKLQGGDVRISREWEAIEEIVGSAVATIRRRVSSTDIILDVPQDLPFLRCDSVLIERVIINLLENAVKYSPSDASIKLSAQVKDQMMHVMIADEGEGIPAEQRSNVFDPFYRLRPSVAGSGLGLTICRSIVGVHGGAIWIEPSFGVGTTVCFTLPLPLEVPEVSQEPSMTEFEKK